MGDDDNPTANIRVNDRGLSNIEWESEELDSVEESEEGDDRLGSNGGQFPSFTMSKKMADFP